MEQGDMSRDLVPIQRSTMRIFSGIQPTGAKHLGNYSGGFRQYAATQEEGEGFFCIVDLHSITVEYDPENLRSSTLDLAAMLFATGLDPDRSTVFVQSHVTAHAEAAWLLSAVTSYGQLARMTQFKEKGERQEFVSAGLFTYPVLMAGDILLYQTDLVPIGDDQRQHLELARNIAERFNQRFGETFTVPEGAYPDVGARIKNLQEPERLMSTTRGAPQGVVRMIDSPDEIRRKFKTAVTDSGTDVRHAPDGSDGHDLQPARDHVRRYRRSGPGARGQVRRQRLRPLQGGRGRRRRRALRSDPTPLRRAPLRRGRAPLAARTRCGEGPRSLGADARADVRAHGLRPAVRPPARHNHAPGALDSARSILRNKRRGSHERESRPRPCRAGRCRLDGARPAGAGKHADSELRAAAAARRFVHVRQR